MSYRGMAFKTFLSSIGVIKIPRRYYAARDCPCTSAPWDDWAGIPHGHKQTPCARRMLVYAGTDVSFDMASEKLKELCHLDISNDVIRAVCDEEGESVMEWLEQAPESAEPFKQARGEPELYTDGTMVNTVDGWREMRLSIFSRREPTTAATPEQWNDRVLEQPTARVAIAAIAKSNVVGSSWTRMLKHLGLKDSPRLSMLADGARWIWDEAAKRLVMINQVDWVVDIYHVSEHINDGAKKMFESPAASQWAEQRVAELVSMEGPAFIAKLQELRPGITEGQSQKALDSLIGYLSENRDSMWYRTRLANGLPIGSGMVEGGCKNTIGKRLKLNSARWRIRRAEHIAALRCLKYSALWASYWDAKHQKRAA
jgi:hypothetical protein